MTRYLCHAQGHFITKEQANTNACPHCRRLALRKRVRRIKYEEGSPEKDFLDDPHGAREHSQNLRRFGK